MNRFKPISISLSPNVEKDDVKLALNLIIRPWLWNRTAGISELEDEFKKYLKVKHAISFNSGRSSLLAILKSLNLESKSEVILQAFTCNAASNPILWLGLQPVYADCNKENFNIDINSIKSRIGEKTKVLLTQNTFGLPVNMDEILQVTAKNNLILIEDCAHALGAEWKGQKMGTFGKAGFFSFSRDKVISSVYGGMAVTNDDELAKNLRQAQKEFGQPGIFWIFQQLLHPILLHFMILPIYNFFNAGKILLVFSQWAYILSKAVHWKEKRGQRPDYFPKALPGALAVLALHQLHKIDKFHAHRRKIFEYYADELKKTSFDLPENFQNGKQSYLRFTVKHPKAHDIIYEAWHKQNILLGDWYTTVIAPFDTKLSEMDYKKGSCKNAEYLSDVTLNLPTHINITQKDAERIVKFLANAD